MTNVDGTFRCNVFCAVEGCQEKVPPSRVTVADWSNKSQLDMVLEFHKAFGLHTSTQLAWPDWDTQKLRRRLIVEECNEVLEALDGDDIVEVASELADLVYVVAGTALAYGIPLDEVFAEVHRANMSKLGEDGKPVYREDGKVLKGKGFKPADVAKVLGVER